MSLEFLLLTCFADLSTGDQLIHVIPRKYPNASESELLTGETSERQSFTRTREISHPALTREVNLATPFTAPSAEDIRESGSAFQSLMVWGKATLINISINNRDMICKRIT